MAARPSRPSYTHDAVGNRLTKTGDTTYTYGDAGEMLSAGGVTTASYTYNGDGVRMSSTVGSTTTDYFWDVATGFESALEPARGSAARGDSRRLVDTRDCVLSSGIFAQWA